MAFSSVKKIGSSLVEEEKPPLLQGNIGSSPLIAEQNGASVDQAKMTSAPQTLAGKLKNKVSQRAENTLEGAKRRKKPKAPEKQTAEQEAYTERLKKLGGLGANIQKMVTDNINEAAQGQAKIEFNEEFLKGKSTEVTSAYESGLDNVNNAIENGADPSSALTNWKNNLAKQLGTDGEPKYDTAEVTAIYESLALDSAQAVADRVAAGTMDADEVSINSLFDAGLLEPEDLGLSEDELTKGLGSDWINMTPPQLEAAVDRLNAIKYGESNQLTSMLSDPMVSRAQKEDIKDRLWDMGFSGALQRETDVDTLAAQVEASGMVEFGGQVRDLDELLSDSGMENMVKDFLNGSDEDKAKFKKQNPELAAYLEKNAEGLDSALELVKGTEKSLNDIKEANKKMTTFGDGVEMTDETLSAIFPDYQPGGYTTEGIDSDNPLFQYLKDNPESAGALVTTINDLAKASPDLIKEALAEAAGDPEKLRALISDLQGSGPEMVESARLNTGIENLPENASADDLVDLIFGGTEMDTGSVMELIKSTGEAAQFDPNAKKTNEALTEIFDADGDGQIDDPKEIAARLKKMGGETGLASTRDDKQSPLDVIAKVASTEQLPPGALQDLVGDYITDENDNLSVNESMNLIRKNPTVAEMESILDSSIQINDAARKKLVGYAKEKVKEGLATEYSGQENTASGLILKQVLSGNLGRHKLEDLTDTIGMLEVLGGSTTGLKKAMIESHIEELQKAAAKRTKVREKQSAEAKERDRVASNKSSSKSRVKKSRKKVADAASSVGGGIGTVGTAIGKLL